MTNAEFLVVAWVAAVGGCLVVLLVLIARGMLDRHGDG